MGQHVAGADHGELELQNNKSFGILARVLFMYIANADPWRCFTYIFVFLAFLFRAGVFDHVRGLRSAAECRKPMPDSKL